MAIITRGTLEKVDIRSPEFVRLVRLAAQATRDLESREEGGRQRAATRICKRCDRAKSQCSCRPWQEEAHRENAQLIAEGGLTTEIRARRIAKRLKLKTRTVKDEIASRKRRARYSKFYPAEA